MAGPPTLAPIPTTYVPHTTARVVYSMGEHRTPKMVSRYDRQAFWNAGRNAERERVLSLKKPKYNSWSEYSRLMHMQFSELKVFWKYIDTEAKNVLIRSARSSTEKGTQEWHRVKKTVNDYDVKGPMGSMDPTLPIDLKDLEKKVLGEDSGLRDRWKKRNLYKWADSQNKQAKMQKPSKRAAATLGRTRLPGEKCIACSVKKSNAMTKLQKLRELLSQYFKLLSMYPGIF